MERAPTLFARCSRGYRDKGWKRRARGRRAGQNKSGQRRETRINLRFRTKNLAGSVCSESVRQTQCPNTNDGQRAFLPFSLSVFFLAPFSFAPPRIFSPVPPLSRSATDIISSGPLFCHRSATVNSAKRRFRTKRRPDKATKSFSLPPARPSHSFVALFQRPFFPSTLLARDPTHKRIHTCRGTDQTRENGLRWSI